MCVIYSDLITRMFGGNLGVDWCVCQNDDDDKGTSVLGILKDASPTSIGAVIDNFESVGGCTWRIGKTAVSKVFTRTVKYACVHRAPTHVSKRSRGFQVGEVYMSRGSIRSTFTCINVSEDEKCIMLFEKALSKMHIGNFEIVDFFRLGSSNKSFGCEAVLIFSKVIAGQSMTEVKWRHNHDLQSFASRSRRDPASFVKEWFVSEYGKGTPPMKALRVYIDELFEHSKLSSRQVVQVMSDR